MIRLKRGMVIDVNLDPAKGSETGKIRPCVIVTNSTYNARVPVIQVVPLATWSEKKALSLARTQRVGVLSRKSRSRPPVSAARHVVPRWRPDKKKPKGDSTAEISYFSLDLSRLPAYVTTPMPAQPKVRTNDPFRFWNKG
jgi:mRNA-degrading endonuclease toxin of MazEF toxin-antitoxin module